jgi:maleylacetate reductase
MVSSNDPRRRLTVPHSVIYEALPSRVIFGSLTSALLKDETARRGIHQPLFLATPPQERPTREFSNMLGISAASVYAGAVMHIPVEVTEAALQVVRDTQAYGVVAVGGGSTTRLAKAIALRTDLPQLIRPTTYAGSEMTPILGQTADGVKRTQTKRQVLSEKDRDGGFSNYVVIP